MRSTERLVVVRTGDRTLIGKLSPLTSEPFNGRVFCRSDRAAHWRRDREQVTSRSRNVWFYHTPRSRARWVEADQKHFSAHFVVMVSTIAIIFAVVFLVVGVTTAYKGKASQTFTFAVSILVAFVPEGLPSTVTLLCVHRVGSLPRHLTITGCLLPRSAWLLRMC